MSKRHHYILAGGKSSRFGSDKARAILQGQTLIERLAQALSPYGPVTAVAQTENSYTDLRITSITDLRPGKCGPLAGLEAALQHRLQHAGEGWIVLLSCDLIAFEQADITPLIARAGNHHAAHVWQQPDGFYHPLPGYYHTRALPHLQQALSNNTRSFQQWLRDIPHQAIPMQKPSFPQANKPEDLLAY